MSLADLWFVIIAVFWTGFFVLEGFDFGVGALHRVVGRSERDRRVAINTIGPFWDGNEVWLVVGAAGIFAAFPPWYATWLSAAYLFVVLLLLALILRGVSFEYRGKGGHRWQGSWSLALTLGSVGAPLVLGVALGDLLAGIPVDSDEEFTGSYMDLLTGFGMWTGLTLLLLCWLHGATFLALRTTGALSGRAQRLALVLGFVSVPVVVVYAVWMVDIADVGWGTYTLLGLAVVALLAGLVLVRGRRDGSAFAATAVAMAASVGSLFVSLYPDVLVSSTSAANSLTVSGSASSDYALKVMTVVAAVFFPLVLLYQGYTYVVFRHRLEGDPTQPLVGAAGSGGQPPT